MKTHLFFLFFCSFFLVTSCASEDFVSPQIDSFNQSTDVYVAGMQNSKACYWKNGTVNYLIDGDSSEVYKIMVENSTVYSAGRSFDFFGNNFYNAFWVNNVKYNIRSYSGTTNSYRMEIHDFYVKNNDIYFTGMHQLTVNSPNEFCFWKNGVKTVVSPTAGSDFSGITVYNGEVYISGNEHISPVPQYGYFHNGTFTQVASGYNNGGIISNGTRLELYGSNNFSYNILSGTMNNISNLSSTIGNSGLVGATLDGNDLYLWQYDRYIKNNVEFLINDPINPFIKDMKAHNSNVYMIRMDPNLQTHSVSLNNVEIQNITNTTGNNGNAMNSIFVVQN